ncbi:class D beta-lactamase [Acinetobacter vivianii]|uniref:Class D beta-lactamase n=1 Tax=Acinetobacter vivianii TaxID=1776742 RepID=A0AAJ6P5U1_9GAMM|nr:class D beta-lactamase [Acinetobacter vivianii]WDZ51819.1 class D beta-lactamase [Acinetobacter vivianii]
MKKTLLASFIITSTSLLFVGCSATEQTENNAMMATQQRNEQQIKHFFDNTNISGVIVIKNGQKTSVYGNHLDRAKTEYVPASTFNMLNALIGLEHNKVTSTEIFKWNGEKQSLAAWEKDMTLGEGMHVSNVPLYQQLALRIGRELMKNEVKRTNFGNNNIGKKVDDFWLVGPLKITPIQEADFAYRFAFKTLPFKQSVQDEVQKMAFLDEKNGRKIYGKTGLGPDGDTKVGWFTGWVEQPNGEKTAFSLNMDMQPDTPYAIRNEIAYQALEQLGVL